MRSTKRQYSKSELITKLEQMEKRLLAFGMIYTRVLSAIDDAGFEINLMGEDLKLMKKEGKENENKGN